MSSSTQEMPVYITGYSGLFREGQGNAELSLTDVSGGFRLFNDVLGEPAVVETFGLSKGFNNRLFEKMLVGLAGQVDDLRDGGFFRRTRIEAERTYGSDNPYIRQNWTVYAVFEGPFHRVEDRFYSVFSPKARVIRAMSGRLSGDRWLTDYDANQEKITERVKDYQERARDPECRGRGRERLYLAACGLWLADLAPRIARETEISLLSVSNSGMNVRGTANGWMATRGGSRLDFRVALPEFKK